MVHIGILWMQLCRGRVSPFPPCWSWLDKLYTSTACCWYVNSIRHEHYPWCVHSSSSIIQLLFRYNFFCSRKQVVFRRLPIPMSGSIPFFPACLSVWVSYSTFKICVVVSNKVSSSSCSKLQSVQLRYCVLSIFNLGGFLRRTNSSVIVKCCPWSCTEVLLDYYNETSRLIHAPVKLAGGFAFCFWTLLQMPRA